ncbi:SDR family NAD(P)-dependent oxidoreductase [Halalkalibacter nanhaiisediminis]|uniref:Ketoreductase domain-containing protein n=1 Tax=Halalkalibacter nanhaiisediminis TaxID=688079 RepID=A0A562QME4_9BACI|nr:SDR family oxidoreductase [Halalkalibacter nanhaiisediminis]TWI57909.1 hypothetical protein IQ10_01238 [Halalkalibacter nanhaiisediminis]
MKSGTVVWITGASSGLGRELAIQAARRGATVVLLARNEARLASVKAEIEKGGGTTLVYTLDVSDQQATLKQAAHILKEVGSIDVLINNAGFAVFEEVQAASIDTVKEMFDVNVIGLIALTKAVLPHMVSKNSGHIINIASQAGKLATPKSSVYAATKHAVLGFTNGLRLELSDTDIHVSAVNPGPIRTPFFDRADEEGLYVKNIEKWMLKPEDVASLTLDLIDKPKRELNLPRWMGIGSTLYQVMPRLFEKVAGKQLRQK